MIEPLLTRFYRCAVKMTLLILPPWMILLGLLTFIAIFVAVSMAMDKRHEGEMVSVAATIGLDYLGQGELSGLDGTKLLRRRGYFQNLMFSKDSGHSIVVFEYCYSKGRDTATQTVAAFPIKTQPFELGPAKWWQRLAALFGYQRICFDQFPAFCKRYTLRGPYEIAAETAFNPDVIRFFEQLSNEWDWRVESNGSWLLIYRDNKPFKFRRENWSLENTFSDRRVPAGRIQEFVDQAKNIAGAFEVRR